jgi:hypothetical protein
VLHVFALLGPRVRLRPRYLLDGNPHGAVAIRISNSRHQCRGKDGIKTALSSYPPAVEKDEVVCVPYLMAFHYSIANYIVSTWTDYWSVVN